MAASPTALFPFINNLVTVDLDRYLGTDHRTDGATRAATVFVETCRSVAGGIQFVRERNHTLRTKRHAYLAAFTELRIDFYLSLYSRLAHKIHYIRTCPFTPSTKLNIQEKMDQRCLFEKLTCNCNSCTL